MSRPFKLALIQMQVEGGDRNKNLRHAKDLIIESASNGAEVVLLPETMDIGWAHSSCKNLASKIPDGEACHVLASIAKELNVYICAGITEEFRGRIYNSAILIDKQGIIQLTHRKINELDIGHEFYALGDKLNVYHSEIGTIGLMICADATAQDRVLTRSLCYMGSDIILSPCAWAMPAEHDNDKEPYGDTWRDAYKPAAKEFSIWIAGASNVGWITDGPWKGRKCIGCSMVIDPKGKEVLRGPYGVDAEKILYVNIEPVKRPARGTDWHEYWDKA